MKTLRINNWRELQHYAKRNPPWIKLHADRLKDQEFAKLPDLAKLTYFMVSLLVAAEGDKDGCIPLWKVCPESTAMLAKPMVNALVNTGFFAITEASESESISPLVRESGFSLDSSLASLSGGLPRGMMAAAFSELWAEYPNRIKRKGAYTHFCASVATLTELAEIREALTRYKAHLTANTWKQPQGGDTWFNNWQDWTAWVEPTKAAGEPIYTGASAEDADAAIWPWLSERVTSWLAVRSAPSTSEEDAAFMHHTNGYSWAYCCEMRDRFTKEIA